MTDQQTLPGLEPQFPYNTPAGKWMVSKNYAWDDEDGVWVPYDDPGERVSHKDATRLYFETDEPPF